MGDGDALARARTEVITTLCARLWEADSGGFLSGRGGSDVKFHP